MATLKDFFGDKKRGDGRKFTNPDKLGSNGWFEPIFLNSNRLVWFGLDRRGYGTNFDANDGSWTEWHPPKPKKKITLYRPVFKNNGGKYNTDTTWHYPKEESGWLWTIVAWEEREVEVDDV